MTRRISPVQSILNADSGLARKSAKPSLFAVLVFTLSLLMAAFSAAPAYAGNPACADGDSDDYVVCNGCDSSGKSCGECDDGDGAVNPGAAEVCGDAIDNNCDGNVDFDLGDACSVNTTNAFGTCLTGGEKVCTGDNTGTECQAAGPLDIPEQEGPAGDPSCFDLDDNNCDGNIDHAQVICQTVELCNGFDDDNDSNTDENFPTLGDACTAGTGVCERNGVNVCKGDGSGVECNAVAGLALTEGPPGSPSCSDVVDNDCDGDTDFPNDSSCLEAEKCDGIDNDNANGVDDGFDVGAGCNNGLLGQCLSAGVKVCTGDLLATTCNAVGDAPAQEGPIGPTCGDGIDNDCDGDTDGDDADCVGDSGLMVSCSLPYLRGRPGSDCNGKHIITYNLVDPSGQATVQAELMGLRADGTIIRTLPANLGDTVHMRSRIPPLKWRFNTRGTRHTVAAPIPLLRVTADDGTQTAQAYCSNIPFLDVIQPAGNVVITEGSDLLSVLAAIPNVDTDTLSVKIDGVDILAALMIDPVTDFPGGPYGGNVMIGSQDVLVSDLVVKSGGGITGSGANTLTMNLFNFTNAGCGAHIILVDGDPIPGIITVDTTPDCQRDDTEDIAIASVFAIDIVTPLEGDITSVVPTPVMGQVCGGQEIVSTLVNGMDVNVAAQVFTAGDGVTSGDLYELDIDKTLLQTNLVDEIAGTTTALGTFDPGSNKLVVLAEDISGNRVAETVNFAVGNVASLSAASLAAAEQTVREVALSTVVGEIQLATLNGGTEIDDAFVLGLEPAAINTFFAETCATATATAEQKIRDSLKAKVFPSKSVNGGISCDPNVGFSITNVTFTGDIACNVTLGTGSLSVGVALPTVNVFMSAYGRCKTTFAGVCTSETIVDIDATFTLTNMRVDFPVTEAQFTAGGTSTGTFVPGNAVSSVTRDDSEVNCLAGFINDVISGFVSFLITIFTFGQGGGFDLAPNFEGVVNEIDLTEKFGISEFTVKVNQIKMNEQEVTDTGKKLMAELDSVTILPAGLTARINAIFSPGLLPDPEIEPTPGSLLTPATAPMPAVAAAGNTFFVVSDDALNQLFASMTTQGEIKTQCITSATTVGDLLPADCSTLILPKLFGFCEGMKRSDCESFGLAAVQGTCHGVQGDDCETIPVGILPAVAENERQACRDQAFNNIFAEMSLLFCGRADVPPYLLIQDDIDLTGSPVITPNQVETHLRLNDLFVAVLVDRGGAGLQGELNALGGCFSSTTDTEGDCKMVATCLDLNMPTTLALDTTGGKLKIVPTVLGVQIPPRPEGAVCEGGFNFGGDNSVLGESSSSDPIDQLMTNVDQLTPPIQSDGLDLGGVVNFNNPRLIAIDTAGGISGFQDYLGITGDIAAPPP